MKRLFSTNLILVFLLTLGTSVFANDTLLLKNIGLILDNPFSISLNDPIEVSSVAPLETAK